MFVSTSLTLKKVGIPGDQTKIPDLHQIWDTHSPTDISVWSDNDFTFLETKSQTKNEDCFDR